MRDGPDDVEQAKEILSEKSLGEGLRYLNNEGWEFEAKGYRWKVWGSPVSILPADLVEKEILTS